MSDATRDNNATEGVDYKFWSQMSGWTVAEAAALLLDIDPDRLPEESEDRGTRGWEYRRLFRLLDRARKMEELSSPMTPREFLAWASSNGLKPPGQLETTVRAGTPHRNWRIRYRAMRKERDRLLAEVEALNEQIADDLNPAARKTLLKLVGGLARVHFKHHTGNHQTVSKIEKLMDNLGWHVANNSIRTHLSEADSLFDQDHPNLK
jgi:hypothetical protein